MHVHENLEQSLAELKALAEREKIALTPEVRAYIQEHVQKAQDKLTAGQNLTQNDLNFIEEVKTWMSQDDTVRTDHPTIPALKLFLAQELPKAQKRRITLRQWLDLKTLAGFLTPFYDPEGWIALACEFHGNGTIIFSGDLGTDLSGTAIKRLPARARFVWGLRLSKCRELKELPAGLVTLQNLDLSDNPGLRRLPEDLFVGGNLNVSHCTGLQRLPENLTVDSLLAKGCPALVHPCKKIETMADVEFHECDRLEKIAGKIHISQGYLRITGCPVLTRISDDLHVSGSLRIGDCPSLKALPENVFIGLNLVLQGRFDPALLEQARRLKEEQKIVGDIKILQ